jgi:hypothetical protein
MPTMRARHIAPDISQLFHERQGLPSAGSKIRMDV